MKHMIAFLNYFCLCVCSFQDLLVKIQRIFNHFKAHYLFSSTVKGLEFLKLNSSTFKDFSRSIWTRTHNHHQTLTTMHYFSFWLTGHFSRSHSNLGQSPKVNYWELLWWCILLSVPQPTVSKQWRITVFLTDDSMQHHGWRKLFIVVWSSMKHPWWSTQHKDTSCCFKTNTESNSPTEAQQIQHHSFLPSTYWPDSIPNLTTLW